MGRYSDMNEQLVVELYVRDFKVSCAFYQAFGFRMVRDEGVVVARGHHLHARKLVTINELREERLIMPRTGCDLPEILDQKRRKQGPFIRYQASESATILAMVCEGIGITIMPRMLLPEKLEGIAGIPLDPPRQVQIGLAVRSAEEASPGATLFVQTAVAWVQGQAALFHRTP
jgi:DNA-binding transcriptional LysR family regulator